MGDLYHVSQRPAEKPGGRQYFHQIGRFFWQICNDQYSGSQGSGQQTTKNWYMDTSNQEAIRNDKRATGSRTCDICSFFNKWPNRNKLKFNASEANLLGYESTRWTYFLSNVSAAAGSPPEAWMYIDRMVSSSKFLRRWRSSPTGLRGSNAIDFPIFTMPEECITTG
jgi:hypothetical protein